MKFKPKHDYESPEILNVVRKMAYLLYFDKEIADYLGLSRIDRIKKKYPQFRKILTEQRYYGGGLLGFTDVPSPNFLRSIIHQYNGDIDGVKWRLSLSDRKIAAWIKADARLEKVFKEAHIVS